jgi:hypothetical protein
MLVLSENRVFAEKAPEEIAQFVQSIGSFPLSSRQNPKEFLNSIREGLKQFRVA